MWAVSVFSLSTIAFFNFLRYFWRAMSGPTM